MAIRWRFMLVAILGFLMTLRVRGAKLQLEVPALGWATAHWQ